MTRADTIARLVGKYKMPRERAESLVTKATQRGEWESEIYEIRVVLIGDDDYDIRKI
jgi:hypothetical protein